MNMTMPNIPDITPRIDLNRADIIDILLASIALQEIGLSHVINAEGEKLQAFIKHANRCDTHEELLEANESVRKTLEAIENIENLLVTKTKYVVEIMKMSVCKK